MKYGSFRRRGHKNWLTKGAFGTPKHLKVFKQIKGGRVRIIGDPTPDV